MVNISGDNPVRQWVAALYFVVTTVSTTGFGKISLAFSFRTVQFHQQCISWRLEAAPACLTIMLGVHTASEKQAKRLTFQPACCLSAEVPTMQGIRKF